MPIQSINPYTRELISKFEEHSDEEIIGKIEAANRAFEHWRFESLSKRSSIFESLALKLRSDADTHAAIITSEMGKPIQESRAEVLKCAWLCEHYAAKSGAYLSAKTIDTDAIHSELRFDPLGVILGIMPWNYPYWQAFRFFVPALMAGNAAILKHASNVSKSAMAMQQLLLDVALPEGLFSVLLVKPGRIREVIANPMVKGVSLTGSEEAGKAVAAMAGEFLKPSLLELGGSNAMIIAEDANLNKAADAIVLGRFQNTGQSCIAAKRIFIHKTIKEELTSLLLSKIAEFQVGNPTEEKTTIGPMAREDLAEKLQDQITRSVDMGAVILTGGSRDGSLFQPTVLDHIKPGMPVFDEETFGPVLGMAEYTDRMEVVELSNQSRFGLGVSIMTESPGWWLENTRLFNEGAVFINSIVKSDPRLPFGGIKQSGYGRELGKEGIIHFTNRKTVYVGK